MLHTAQHRHPHNPANIPSMLRWYPMGNKQTIQPLKRKTTHRNNLSQIPWTFGGRWAFFNVFRTVEHDGDSKPNHPVDSFQSCDDILNWISGQVDETSTFPLCVSRTDIFNRGMQQWQRQKKTSPKCRLKVTFFGEAGIDTGALSKEFLTDMLAEIERKLFVCSADKKGKNPLYCLNSLDQIYFRSAGEIMATSLAQGGPPPAFIRE
ncbi:hypothetical protein AOLI_G00203560 [Acnodon oligacanthus]